MTNLSGGEGEARKPKDQPKNSEELSERENEGRENEGREPNK